ncbi:hypothetical protein CsSME_00022461 [Camellia sinensis var. sinensis]
MGILYSWSILEWGKREVELETLELNHLGCSKAVESTQRICNCSQVFIQNLLLTFGFVVQIGKLKRRIQPRDITINIGKDAPIPKCPIPSEKWKEIRHDNIVTWLAFWNDPINPKEFKYVFLVANSSLKGQSDKEKYEKSRMLKVLYIKFTYTSDKCIRAAYTKDFASKDVTKRQIAVATYLIDKLALRAGNERR